MISFAELTHVTKSGYETIKTEVKVIELTHEKSANKRAIIEYKYKGQLMRHFISRSRLTYLSKSES
jgi:hypothetical protein